MNMKILMMLLAVLGATMAQGVDVDAVCSFLKDTVDENTALKGKIAKLEAAPKCYKSCAEAYAAGEREDKAYELNLDSGKTKVYCQMSDIEGCGSGGFTMVMKINGAKQTFLYDSALWCNHEAHNIGAGVTGLDQQETKLPTYSETPFTKICLGMSFGQETRFISINQEAPSLYSLIADNQYRATSIGRDAWKSLLADSSLQRNCNKEGFNAARGNDKGYSRARIGITSNQEDNCLSNDSRIGFGTGGRMDDTASCGNSAGYSPDNGNKNIRAFGYILVQ